MGLEIAFATVPNMLGHLNPLLPYAEELLRRGHSVTFFHGKDPKYRKKIEDSGISACKSVAYDGSLYDSIKEYYHDQHYHKSYDDDHPKNSSSSPPSPPSVIVHDFFATDAADAADFLEVAAVCVFPNMAVTVNPWANAGAHSSTGITASSLLWWAWCGAAIPVLEGVLARVLLWKRNRTREGRDLPPLTEQDYYPTRYQPKVTAAGRPRVTIGCASPLLEFNSATELGSDVFAMVGPALTATVEPVGADLDRWLAAQSERGRNVVYVAFGSEYEYTPEIVRTLEDELSGRRDGVAFLWSLPEKYQPHLSRREEDGGETDSGVAGGTHADHRHFLRVESHLPQVALFRTGKIDAFVTHCGSNSVCEALLSGVPMVCCPRKADQPGNAVRLARKGVGVIARNGIAGVGAALDELLGGRLGAMKADSDELSRLLRSGEGGGGAERAASVIEGVIAHRRPTPARVGSANRRMPVVRTVALAVLAAGLVSLPFLLAIA